MRTRTVLIVIVSLVLLMTGCKSSRKTVRGSSHYEISGSAGSKEERRKEIQPDFNQEEHPLIAEARNWIGTPYKYGGQEKGVGTDCSGMVMEVYRKVTGIKLPRNSAAQQEFCIPLKRENLETGDLVFFSSKRGGDKVSHVGIFISEGAFIHASSSKGVITSNLEEIYYATHFHSCGRVPSYIIEEKAKAETKADSIKNEVRNAF